jgi:hypothetical protein
MKPSPGMYASTTHGGKKRILRSPQAERSLVIDDEFVSVFSTQRELRAAVVAAGAAWR